MKSLTAVVAENFTALLLSIIMKGFCQSANIIGKTSLARARPCHFHTSLLSPYYHGRGGLSADFD